MTWPSDSSGDPASHAPAVRAPVRPPFRSAPRLRAALQVLLCSGIPTQMLLIQVLAAFGHQPFLDGGRLNITWIVAVSIADTALLVSLVLLLLHVEGESPREVFLGHRHPLREIPLGLATVIPLLLITAALIHGVRELAPWLHNVPVNPFAQLLDSPANAWLFAVVALIGGGVREEIQRAFLLTRFEQHLGGATVGLVVTSIAFGLGHVIQGLEAGIATGTLGLAWGAMYLWRRSALAPIASHAGFNALEIVRYLVFGPGTV